MPINLDKLDDEIGKHLAVTCDVIIRDEPETHPFVTIGGAAQLAVIARDGAGAATSRPTPPRRSISSRPRARPA